MKRSVQNPAIADVVHNAMKESGEGLIQEFNFDPDTRHAYMERIFRRFQNPRFRTRRNAWGGSRSASSLPAVA